ncbi:hypothetical protein [Streptomyces sp. NPDC059819]|uniref:hypothetical protein n=1 Tax=Streptomyces sp. NPDC059819 TaxID=3346963 RepID=UPI0036661190
MMIHRTPVRIAGALGVAATLLIAAPSAHAATGDPSWTSAQKNQWMLEACDPPGSSAFKFTLYYGGNFQGAYRNMGYSVYNFADENPYPGHPGPYPLQFCLHVGSGSGQDMKNAAASAKNAHATYIADVYYNSGWKGAVDDISWGRNLNYTFNNNASFKWRS